MKKVSAIIASVILAIVLISWGLVNKRDDRWISLDRDLKKEFFLVENAKDSINQLFQKMHQVSKEDLRGFELISTPFIPTMEMSKFNYFLEQVMENKKVVLSSVSGVGSTTLTNRIAKFIAGDYKHILEIRCAPNFDLILHKKYIGESIDGEFQPGILLQLFEKCYKNPNEKFVLLIDNFDKINPESFWGPEFWEKLSDPGFEFRLGEKSYDIPNNLYMISVIHAGASGKIQLSNDHFRRIGKLLHLEVNSPELIINLRERRIKTKQQLKNNQLTKEERIELQNDLAALQDTFNIKRMIYSFEKINEYIEKEYSKTHRLGQWGNLRKLYHAEDYDEFVNVFLNHVNSIQSNKDLRQEDLDKLFYALENDGKLKGSNFINRQFLFLEEKGFLTEFIVGLSFIIISGLFSFYILRKREHIINKKMTRVIELIEGFDNQKIDHDEILKEFKGIKSQIDNMAIKKKINYEEAIFFYKFFEDKSRKIEISKEAHSHYQLLVDAFMEDGVISEGEYEKLVDFLNKIKSKIGKKDYEFFKADISNLYDKYRAN